MDKPVEEKKKDEFDMLEEDDEFEEFELECILDKTSVLPCCFV